MVCLEIELPYIDDVRSACIAHTVCSSNKCQWYALDVFSSFVEKIRFLLGYQDSSDSSKAAIL